MYFLVLTNWSKKHLLEFCDAHTAPCPTSANEFLTQLCLIGKTLPDPGE